MLITASIGQVECLGIFILLLEGVSRSLVLLSANVTQTMHNIRIIRFYLEVPIAQVNRNDEVTNIVSNSVFILATA